MKIIILTLSTCLVACANQGSVLSTNQRDTTSVNPPSPVVSVAERSQHADSAVAGATSADALWRPLTAGDSPPAESGAALDPRPKVPYASPQHASAKVTYGQEDDQSVFMRTSYHRDNLFSVGTLFTREKRLDDSRLPMDEDRGFWQMKLGSSGGGRGLDLKAEFALSSFNPDTSEGFGVSENRLIKLSTKKSWRGFVIGARYQSVGHEFEFHEKTAAGTKKRNSSPQSKLHRGRQTTEAWLSRQFGKLGVKTLVSRYEDESENSVGAPHFTTHKVGGVLDYSISSWPRAGITLDYSSGVRGGSNDAGGVQTKGVSVENLAGSLYYSNGSLSGTFYVENAIGAGTTDTTNLRTYWLGASYSPISTLTITPSASYLREEYPEFGAKTDRLATSMTLNYRTSIKSRFSFIGYSEYSTEKNSDWAMDSEYLYSSLGINWNSNKPRSPIQKWSFELFHDLYADNVYSANNVGGLGFMAKLSSRTAPLRRITEEIR